MFKCRVSVYQFFTAPDLCSWLLSDWSRYSQRSQHVPGALLAAGWNSSSNQLCQTLAADRCFPPQTNLPARRRPRGTDTREKGRCVLVARGDVLRLEPRGEPGPPGSGVVRSHVSNPEDIRVWTPPTIPTLVCQTVL